MGPVSPLGHGIYWPMIFFWTIADYTPTIKAENLNSPYGQAQFGAGRAI